MGVGVEGFIVFVFDFYKCVDKIGEVVKVKDKNVVF